MPIILTAGDQFVLNSLLADALKRHAGSDLDIRELTLPWPVEPYGPIGEVNEASGDENELIKALQGATICVTQMAPLTSKVLDGCPDLRLFSITRGGPVNANLAAATAHGVAVAFTPGRNATATAEHTVALILAAVRQIPQRNAELLGGAWRSDYYRYVDVGPEIDGSTVGLIGYGAVGSRVAQMLTGMGAQVLVHDPYLKAADLPDGVQIADSLEELLTAANILTMHARLTPETQGMIGRDQIGLLPDGAVLINAARGGLVDHEAVCDALEAGKLYSAGLDVYPTEPLPADSRLRTLPTVVMTPHLAGASRPTAHNAAEIAAADIARFLQDEPLDHCANPEVFNNFADPSI